MHWIMLPAIPWDCSCKWNNSPEPICCLALQSLLAAWLHWAWLLLGPTEPACCLAPLSLLVTWLCWAYKLFPFVKPVCCLCHFFALTHLLFGPAYSLFACLCIHSCLHSHIIPFACTLASMAAESLSTCSCLMVPVCLLESPVAAIGSHAGLLACLFIHYYLSAYPSLSCWSLCLLNCPFTSMLACTCIFLLLACSRFYSPACWFVCLSVFSVCSLLAGPSLF